MKAESTCNQVQAPSESVSAAGNSLTLNGCTCPETITRFGQACKSCQREWAAWSEDQNAAARTETIFLSAAQFFAAMELFDAQMSEAVITVRTVIAERAA